MSKNIFIRLSATAATVAAVAAAASFVLAVPALAEEQVESAPSIAQAQTSAPAGGDGRLATLGDISGLRTDFGAEMRAFRAENERRWSELRSDLSSFKNTVIILLGGILATLLWPWVSRLWERRNSPGKASAATTAALLAVLLLSGCGSTGWEKFTLSDKRILILEEDIQASMVLGLTASAFSGQEFVLKFRDSQNNRVYVGDALRCNAIKQCGTMAASIVVPENAPAEPWTIHFFDKGWGEISPVPVKHRVESVE